MTGETITDPPKLRSQLDESAPRASPTRSRRPCSASAAWPPSSATGSAVPAGAIGLVVARPTSGRSVDRALRILAVLQGDHRLTLGEIAQRLELPPSTVHGILRTLLAHRVVVQEHDSGRYRLGPAVLTMGNVYLDTLELRSRVTPWAEDLARRTGLAVRTAVMLVDDVVVVHHEPRPDGSRQMPEVGIVIPAHASALGKAILAFDDELAHDLLDSHRPPGAA